MRKILLSLILSITYISLIAQAPNAFKYQIVARNASGELITNQNIGVQISILQGSTTIYTETHTKNTNAYGHLNLDIGKGTSEDDFSLIDWSDGTYFIQIEMDVTGGSNYNLIGTSQILSVPYALQAKTVENIVETDPVFNNWDRNYLDLTNTPEIFDSIKAVIDTTNQFVRTEIDGDINNEIQDLANVLYIGNNADNNSIINISQQGIGTDNPHTSAALEVSSSDKGVLIPRMNLNDIKEIKNPEPGLIVMDTTNGEYNILVFDGLEWIKVINNSSSYENLVLWNELGSVEEIENSKFGENGIIVGESYNFEPAYDGNGYVRTATGDNYVNFPGSVLQNLKEKGTVELWINPKVTNPIAYSYGVFALCGNIFGTNSHVYIAWGDGTSGTGLYGSVNFDGTGHQTPFESEQFVAEVGTPFHVAICWDINGIDESQNTVRLYRNGELVNAINDTWDSENTTTNYEGFSLGLGPDGQGYDKFIVDELKVWNYAKTNFETSEGTHISGDLEVDGVIKGEIVVDSIHVSKITGLLGQNYTLVFPQVLDNTVAFELEGISTSNVVIVSGPGHETERISEYLGENNGETLYKENAGLTMEYPLIFETTNETDMLAIKAWFDEASPVKRSASIVIKNLAETETGRWILLNYLPDGYELGNDGRTRFTMVPSSTPDNILECEYQNYFGSEHSYNPATDSLVEIEGIDCGGYGQGFTPAVELNLEERTITLTMDYNEGYIIYDWAKMIIAGDPTMKAMSIINTTDGTPGTEIYRYNYFNCIPIIYEHFYGFGLNTKLKARLVIAYGFREKG